MFSNDEGKENPEKADCQLGGAGPSNQPVPENVHKDNEEFAGMHPDRQAILWKKKKHIRFPRAERKRMLQQKALNGNEDRIRRAILAELEQMDKHWDNLTKLFVALAKLEENKEEE
ncbi:uncharacterized protein N7458_007329 [Penicillium daleae]|uniref:Uncharacterized protein n=1 Tax=Penicillium daleae TaxID=63821 RepID=A0AAD6FZV2_9EURO|nr:uncharacterized protein N7458_007329 [Penicillium daleae]KAJ5443457.1 hypothetical protein N7458_007329 [Penicillium daleae]